MKLRVSGIATEHFARLRHGGRDWYGQKPLIRIAEGGANPCRHCLGLIADGEDKLVLAYRPFEGPHHPYAETGPIFLHARDCTRYQSDALPGWFRLLDPAAVRGYGADGWIRYETGAIVRGAELSEACADILRQSGIAFVHVRSKFGCFQCQVERG